MTGDDFNENPPWLSPRVAGLNVSLFPRSQLRVGAGEAALWRVAELCRDGCPQPQLPSLIPSAPPLPASPTACDDQLLCVLHEISRFLCQVACDIISEAFVIWLRCCRLGELWVCTAEHRVRAGCAGGWAARALEVFLCLFADLKEHQGILQEPVGAVEAGEANLRQQSGRVGAVSPSLSSVRCRRGPRDKL